jgi:hypothetical protein
VLTWSEVDSTTATRQTRLQEDIIPGQTIFAEAGEGIFGNAVRFRNPETNFCVTDEFVDVLMVQCDVNDPSQVSQGYNLARVEADMWPRSTLSFNPLKTLGNPCP